MGQEMGDGRGHVPAMAPGQDISGGDMLFRSAQADQTDSTATVESTSVPSMSKRTAWKSASRGSVRVIVISVLPG
ncbi:hypothetical protein HMPREF1280_00564 [Propionibacterium sp. KPL1854]|nr:hypothetical protein HMPREF1280_00564 [Propionibacterium sp. KPL1854]